MAWGMWFQSTPPRGRRHGPWPLPVDHVEVSIHASAREATVRLDGLHRLGSQFQSTPPRGRRLGVCQLARRSTRFNPRLRAGGDHRRFEVELGEPCFNPRLRAGGDELLRRSLLPTDLVSIHASAREATWPGIGTRRRISTLFQSTPPRGRRPNRRRHQGPPPTSFNPRLRAGGEAADLRAAAAESWFQSTPPRGRRRERNRRALRPRHGFNPRLRAGGDCGAGSASFYGGSRWVSANLVFEGGGFRGRVAGFPGGSLSQRAAPASSANRLQRRAGRLGFAPRRTLASGDEGAFEVEDGFDAVVLDPASPVRPEKVEAEAVFRIIEFLEQAQPELRPLGRVDDALGDGVLER